MAYSVDTYNRSKTFVVQDGTINNELDIRLVGKNFSGYGEISPNTDKARIEALYDIFISEYGFNIERYGFKGAVKEWLQGLPSCINIDFYNCDIIARAKLYGKITKDADEKREDLLLARYWDYMAMRVIELFKQYNLSIRNK